LQELAAAPPLCIDSKVGPRPDLVLRLREEPERLVVLFGATEISLPLQVRDAVMFAVAGGGFCGACPPASPGARRRVVSWVPVVRLLREGLLLRYGQTSARFGPGRPHNGDAP